MRAKNDLQTTERREEAVDLLVAVLSAFGREQTLGSQALPITPTGRSIFRELAARKGSFFRPVPFRRDELAELTHASKGAVNMAIRQLSTHGFLSLTGSRSAPMAMLFLPQAAIDDFKLREKRKAKQARDQGYDIPLWSLEIDDAKSVLDEK